MTVLGRLGRLAGVLLLVLLSGAAWASTSAQATTVADVIESLRSDPVYNDSKAELRLTDGQEARLRAQIASSGTPIYLAILPKAAGGAVAVGERIENELDRPATYAIVVGNDFVAHSRLFSGADELARQATLGGNDLFTGLTQFVEEAAAAASGAPVGSGADDATEGFGAPTSDSGRGGLPLFPIAAVVAIVVVGLLAIRGRARSAKVQAADLAAVRPAAEEDVTRLGEDIATMDLDVEDPALDPETREDYRHALDAYDTAKVALEAAGSSRDLARVSTALEDGRYSLACVQAAKTGLPRPERRPPCFFNPQHGPSVTDTLWTPSGGAARQVPVCAADADRLAHGDEPETRQVLVGGVRRPYYDAGPAWGPWAGGYYGGYGGAVLPAMLVGTMLGNGLSGWGHGGAPDTRSLGDSFGGGHVGGGGGFGGGSFGGGGGGFGGGSFGGGGGGGGGGSGGSW